VARDAQGFISAQSEEAAKLKELQATYGALTEQGTLSDMFQQQRQDLGIDTDMQELKDINLRLADSQTASNLTKTRIEGADGQTIGQAQREVTQEDREAAVRMAGDAARAAVLQGNIQTATQLAKDTVDLAFQDRQLKATNLLNQITMLQGQVDDQTAQLLEQEKRGYEAELAQIKELKDNIASAMVSGANQSEIAQLNDPNLDDASKLVLAQQITARGSNQMRDLDIESKRSGIAANYASIDLAERKFQYQQQQDALAMELSFLKESGQISEDKAAGIQKVEQALTLKDLVSQIKGHAGFNLSVGSVGQKLFDPREGMGLGMVYNYLSGQGEGFDGLYDQLTENLTLSNLDKMSGVLTDKDIQVLRSAATRLRKSTSEGEFLGVLDEMERTFDRAVQENGLTPQQAKFYYGVDDDALSEVDTIWGVTGTTTGIDFNY
jgi:hypothetical protein